MGERRYLSVCLSVCLGAWKANFPGVCFGPQLDLDDPAVLRDDRAASSAWQKLKRDVEEKRSSTQISKECSKVSINCKSLSSPANILWELLCFNTIYQLVVDVFHNLHEGHANLLYGFFRVLTSFAMSYIKAAWEDNDLWDPDTGEYVNVALW